MKYEGIRVRHGRALKTCRVKEARHKGPSIVGFHSYETSRMDKSIETEGRFMVPSFGGEGGI